MKTMLVTSMVLTLFAAAAHGAITHTITLLGTYTLGLGAGPTIDVYKVKFEAGVDHILGALVLDVGTHADPSYGQPGADPDKYRNPFQAAWVTSGGKGKPPIVNLTPTKDDADGWLTPPDTSKCYECDTHFMPGGIQTWTPVVVLPGETNDGSIYNSANAADDYKAGKGVLTVATAVPVAFKTRGWDGIRVGVVSGDTVYCKSGCANELGEVTHETFLIPEPATMSLLALGALAFFRRKRGYGGKH